MAGTMAKLIESLESYSAEIAQRPDEHPEFDAAVQGLRDLWRDEGQPTLRRLDVLEKEIGPTLARLAKMDWKQFRRAGVRSSRIEPVQDGVKYIRDLLFSTKQRLADIPSRIDALTFNIKEEGPHLIGGKQTDYVRADLRGVLGVDQEIRERYLTLEHQLGEVERDIETPGSAQGDAA